MVDNVLVDVLEKGGDLSQLEKDLSESVQNRKVVTAGAKKAAQKVEDSSNDDVQLPAKLRGKSLEQIAEMYVNLESAHGRMANDLGTQRKMTDRLLDLKRDTDLQSNSPHKVEIKSSELLENPTEALERFSQARDAQSQARLDEMESRLAAQTFVTQHPDYRDYENNAEFTAWIQSSPIRLRAASAATRDWSLAADLLTEFKAARAATKLSADDDETATEEQDDDVEKQARSGAKKASLESGSQGSSGTRKSGKVYRRADLMRLKAERRDVWEDEDFQNEILRAYAEGRVK